MEFLHWFIDFFLHLDQHLAEIIARFGVHTYTLLFLIVFCETGLVVTPILPGDSLLFAAGAFAAQGSLDAWLLFWLLSVAAILGDTVNYAIGHYLGPKVFHYPRSRFFNPEHLRKTHAFYERHGGKTIIIARFIPIVRTFAPFVAGIGAMSYAQFLLYNVTGALLWVSACVGGGYFFGNIPVVRENFSLAVIAIVLVSVTPGVIGVLRHRRAVRQAEGG
ncbi:MAG: Protein DedA [Pseudomonadales bacterium]|nr:Protein DedA [Pseudomonadales bacterium]